MVIDLLNEWRNEYQKSLDIKLNQYTDVLDKVEIIKLEIEQVQTDVDSDEQVFSPNDMYAIDQNRLDAAKKEKNQLQETGDKLNQSIAYLKNRIDQLDGMITDLIARENVVVQNSNESIIKEDLLFVSSIIESDPRRSKVELLSIIDRI